MKSIWMAVSYRLYRFWFVHVLFFKLFFINLTILILFTRNFNTWAQTKFKNGFYKLIWGVVFPSIILLHLHTHTNTLLIRIYIQTITLTRISFIQQMLGYSLSNHLQFLLIDASQLDVLCSNRQPLALFVNSFMESIQTAVYLLKKIRLVLNRTIFSKTKVNSHFIIISKHLPLTW